MPPDLHNVHTFTCVHLCLQQTVCGFDLLRASGQSYVCDVNGFSFVKNSMKYYDDCAKILGLVHHTNRKYSTKYFISSV